MSGGAFDYRQYHIEEIADDIERAIIEAGREIPKEVYNRWYGRSSDDSDRIYPTYDRKTIDIMKRAVYPNWINDFWRIMGLIHFGDKLPWPSTTLPPKSAASATMHPMPSWKSSPPPTSPPSSPAFRSAAPLSPQAKKPRKLWPIPSAAPSRPWVDMLTSSCPASTGNLSVSGACHPPHAPIPCRLRKRPRPIGNCSDYNS